MRQRVPATAARFRCSCSAAAHRGHLGGGLVSAQALSSHPGGPSHDASVGTRWPLQHPRFTVRGGVARRCSEMPSDPSRTKAATADRGSVRVSVVIDVYNAGALLRSCLNSVLAQEMPPEAFEAIAVDDGSSDGSGALLDDYAEAHRILRVIHQANSGWPGRPRNVGTAAARGDYVFYLDADDMLGAEALRRMVAFADQHGSDVVLVRTQWLRDGRPVRAPAVETEVDARLGRVFRSLAPHKLLRRSFLESAGLRFPEGRVRLEDGIFMARPYPLAPRASTLGDYDYYYRRANVPGGNISRSRIDPHAYARSVETIMEIVRELDPDPRRADRIVLGLYRRNGLKFFGAGRLERYEPRRPGRSAAPSQRLPPTGVPRALEPRRAAPRRGRWRAVRRGDVDALIRLAGSTPTRSRLRWLRAVVRAWLL